MLCVVFICGSSQAQVDKAAVESAINKGCDWLKTKVSDLEKQLVMHPWGSREAELVLLTLVHGGLDESDAAVATLTKMVTETPLRHTYPVALQAMALAKLDPVKYKKRLAECGQFLLDNQCKNGQWSYGEEVPSSFTNQIIDTGGTSKPRPKTEIKETIILKKNRDGPPSGDNSNSQYAALGIRACTEAGVIFPKDTVKKALDWWEGCQVSDGGWGYSKGDTSYGSMTTAGICSTSIYVWLMGLDWKKNENVQRGVKWLADHFKIEENPNRQTAWLYYYIYSIERTGMLYGTETFDKHKWYEEGAPWLVGKQSADGSWNNGIQDTCFAILFLRRSTKPLKIIETGKPPK